VRNVHLMYEPDQTADLRRRRKREQVEQILARASWLPESDRAVLEAVFREGKTVAEVAALIGCPARALRRRVRRLLDRVQAPRFVFVTSRLDGWPPTRRRVARACVIEWCSLRDAARQLGISLYAVRRHHEAINAQLEAVLA